MAGPSKRGLQFGLVSGLGKPLFHSFSLCCFTFNLTIGQVTSFGPSTKGRSLLTWKIWDWDVPLLCDYVPLNNPNLQFFFM